MHAALGHIDWTAALLLAIGAVPGARLGATIALGANERALRLMVGSFLALVALAYGVQQIASSLVKPARVELLHFRPTPSRSFGPIV